MGEKRHKHQLISLQNASIIRKFAIFYFLASILPVSMLYFLYLQLKDYGQVVITEEQFSLLLMAIVVGVMIGFIAMRSVLLRIINLARTNRSGLEGLLDSTKMKALRSGNTDEIAVLAESFNQITSRLEDNVRNLQLAKRTLHSVLARVGEGISNMDNIDNFLNLILETVTDAMQCEVGVLLLTNKRKPGLYIKDIYSKDSSLRKFIGMTLTNGLFNPVMESKDPMILEEIPKGAGPSGLFRAPMLSAPLILHSDVLGIISVSGRMVEGSFPQEEKGLLHNIALQTAVAIENSKLNDDAERTYFETISALALAVEAKDQYSRGHSDRVANFCVEIGKEMNLSQEDISILRDAAKLHDIGKIGISDDVLMKHGPLDVQERAMMNRHPEIGEGIIKPIRSLRNLCDIVRHHHEKLDGTGYPDGLKGHQILTLARILAVADIYDALTTNRPYRGAYTHEKAIEKMREMKDKIDQKVVDAFVRIKK